jgi:hypothetical protein
MSKKDFIQYGKDHGYYGLNKSEIRGTTKKKGKDIGYYYAAIGKGLVDEIFTKKNKNLNYKARRKPRNWKDMSKKDFIQYGKDRGYDKLNPIEIAGTTKKKGKDTVYYKKGKDQGYYDEARKRGLVDEIFKRKFRDWVKMSNDEIIQYGIDNKLSELSPTEVQNRDRGYYYIVRDRGLIDKVFKKKRITTKDVLDFINGNESAKTVASLAKLNCYMPETVQLLSDLWPDRFPAYDKLLKQMPKFVPKIGFALGPLSFTSLADAVYEKNNNNMPADVKQDVNRILVRIGIDEYQARFNQDPEGMLAEIQKYERKYGHNGAREIFRSIGNYYESVYEFKIPGYGSLKKR